MITIIITIILTLIMFIPLIITLILIMIIIIKQIHRIMIHNNRWSSACVVSMPSAMSAQRCSPGTIQYLLRLLSPFPLPSPSPPSPFLPHSFSLRIKIIRFEESSSFFPSRKINRKIRRKPTPPPPPRSPDDMRRCPEVTAAIYK